MGYSTNSSLRNNYRPYGTPQSDFCLFARKGIPGGGAARRHCARERFGNIAIEEPLPKPRRAGKRSRWVGSFSFLLSSFKEKYLKGAHLEASRNTQQGVYVCVCGRRLGQRGEHTRGCVLPKGVLLCSFFVLRGPKVNRIRKAVDSKRDKSSPDLPRKHKHKQEMVLLT